MCGSSKRLKVLLRLLLLLGMAGILIVEAAENEGNTKHYHHHHHNHQVKAYNAARKEKLIIISRVVSKLDLNYVSRRKIPNGPDPIHNRRAGNSRQPPGQA